MCTLKNFHFRGIKDGGPSMDRVSRKDLPASIDGRTARVLGALSTPSFAA